MVGTLSGIQAVGTGVGAQMQGGGTLSVTIGSVELRPINLGGSGSLAASRIPGYRTPGALAGVGALDIDLEQLYATPTALLAAGALVAGVYGSVPVPGALAGPGALTVTGLERYLAPTALGGSGEFSTALGTVEPRACPFGGLGTLEADILPSSQAVVRVDHNVSATSQSLPFGSGTAGAYVTLIGAGGKGGTGSSGSSGNLPGGGGGGGGAAIERVFIPASSFGATYSCAQSATGATTFTTGSVSLSAGAGVNGAAGQAGGAGAGGGAGGTASASGITATLRNGTAGGRGSGLSSGDTAPAAPNNTTGSGAGAGGGGGVGSNGTATPAGRGGNSATATGGGSGVAGGNGAAGLGGSFKAGAGGGGNALGGTAGGGGGGGSAPNGAAGKVGGPGDLLIEWVAQVNYVLMGGGGTLSATAVPVYQRNSALSGGGQVSAVAVPAAQHYADTFDRANGDLGALWVPRTGTTNILSINSNKIIPLTASPAVSSYALAMGTNNMRVVFTISSAFSTSETVYVPIRAGTDRQLIVRCLSGDNWSILTSTNWTTGTARATGTLPTGVDLRTGDTITIDAVDTLYTVTNSRTGQALTWNDAGNAIYPLDANHRLVGIGIDLNAVATNRGVSQWSADDI
jgi:hypothetical protein